MAVQHYILSAYNSAVDSFGSFENSFHRPMPLTNSEILHGLRNCCFKLDEIMMIEPDMQTNMVSLIHMKKHVNFLIETVEKRETFAAVAKNGIKCGNNCSNNSIIPNCAENNSGNQENKMELDIRSILQTPKIASLQEVVGLHHLKKTLKSLVILPKMQPQLFENRKLCNSVLLFGPPGTGKTRLVHGLAAEAGAQLFCISASDVLSHFVGRTEKAIKTIFSNLKTNSNFSLLFIDEIDGFCRKRTDSEQEYTRRIKTELMCQLSNIDTNRNIFIIAATNCPWDLDIAILRRFQKRIYLPLPSACERLQLLQYFMQNEAIECNNPIWSTISKATEGYSASDLSDIVHNAMSIALDELQEAKIWRQCHDGYFEPLWNHQDLTNVICSELSQLPANSVRVRRMHLGDLVTACKNVKATVCQEEIKKFERFTN